MITKDGHKVSALQVQMRRVRDYMDGTKADVWQETWWFTDKMIVKGNRAIDSTGCAGLIIGFWYESDNGPIFVKE